MRGQRHLMGKGQSFQQMVLGKLDIHMQKKINLDPYAVPYIKINSKCTKDLNRRVKAMTLVGKNIKVNLHNLGFGNSFFF